MLCCPDCFTHLFLKDFIENSPASKRGKCSYCSSKNTLQVIAPPNLSDLFQPVFDLYIESAGGTTLNEQLQADWQLFSKALPLRKQQKLLSDISLDDSFEHLKVIPLSSPGTAFIDMWNDFKNELLHENRFFPKNAIKTDNFKELLAYLTMNKEDYPTSLYRARVSRGSSAYDITEMGKPPKDKATAGRANPQGIPYFYLASDHKTAIAETRPYKSENVCVGRYKVSKKARFIDLREPKKIICPVSLDEDNLQRLYKEHMPFLEHLSYTLSIPVSPTATPGPTHHR